MSATFTWDDDPYEALTVAMTLIDAALVALGDHDEAPALLDCRNRINSERVALLGNGAARPFSVADMRGR
ncbi:hypothetical protein RGUI_2747 [Rhodovulum sp. P5]|uniref:hypothetical protein n=1 Tax=Rhodovulum sp. P5 TaxID=1564506 RepID=UPI0009C37B65|nr:hypothetical protein [Rhodovulum sp. P5]ARE40888.1 hypothetical protein RGUI_2747 [Rhodovulum sp. P5]